ncbi:MAG: uracil-DNA glycosylase [Candidatus Hadarchaeota archaeon]|nr:uracil-DNA glycosylase [Candidatus Hadarchaeota archaeon]
MKSNSEKDIKQTLEKLESEARACTRCELYKTRTNVAFGTGPPNADIMMVGEAAGYREDQLGAPFVGTAGKELDKLLKKADLSREDDVYITNVVKCRPPQNRDPTDEEIETCSPYLQKQIQLIKPKLIVTLGRFAARVLLGRPVSMGRSHGTLVDCSYGGWHGKLLISYHPAAALYGTSRDLLEEDFRKLGKIVKKLDTLRVSQQTKLELR